MALAAASSFLLGYVVVYQANPTSLSLLEARPSVGALQDDSIELVAVFVASSTCGATATPGLKESLGAIQAALSRQAAAKGLGFRSIGVALDRSPGSGFDFLSRFGHFDEISAGGGWQNSTMITFMVRDFPAKQSIPQLILIDRHLETAASKTLAGVSDRLVGRKVGFDQIIAFAHSTELDKYLFGEMPKG